MYEIFEFLLKSKNVITADVVKATGLNASFFSEWKKGKSKTPKTENLQKVADYFGVTLDYLMNGEEPAFDKWSTESALIVENLRADKEMNKAILKYFNLSEKEKKHVVELINLLSKED